jgi:hypothetical protein
VYSVCWSWDHSSGHCSGFSPDSLFIASQRDVVMQTKTDANIYEFGLDVNLMMCLLIEDDTCMLCLAKKCGGSGRRSITAETPGREGPQSFDANASVLVTQHIHLSGIRCAITRQYINFSLLILAKSKK